MHIREEDLVQAFQSRGEAFEEFVRDLVRAVGRSCGIDPIHLAWDYRTNVRDGGRDLIVNAPNTRSDKKFIPDHESIWSLKSGEEGVSPAALKKEITDSRHPKVKEAVKKGWTYVWCTVHPANHDTKDKMREAADDVASQLGLDPKHFEFRWLDNLVAEAGLYPNVIAGHLPTIATLLSGVLSLKQWGRDLENRDRWVNFGGRDDVVRRITQHLLGRQSPNVLHVAGLSGIGKTRTVYEACQRQPELQGVFYVERFERVGATLYHYLEEDGRNVQLVVDETRLSEVDRVAARLAEFSDRIRVVTIGPASKQSPISGGQIIILPEPDTVAGVLEVVRAAGGDLPDELCRGIAEQSGHDLRLALLLVRASQQLPAFRGIPIFNFDGVWQRLMALFSDQIGDPNLFRERFEILTVSIDVGFAEDVGGEVELLAKLFSCPVDHLLSAANSAADCGLGIRTRRFFEATPRALAARLFETRVWCRIRDRLDDFTLELLGHSERLARRFFERCQDCSGDVREEVMGRVGDFFLKALHGEDVTVLSSRNTSRLFEAWAEFDPDRGLNWLRQAVEQASAEQLLALDGQPDASGGWRGRRQLVWLCQNLASFAEYFAACEAILFRLALHETEPDIGNNSLAIWQSLFWPILAATEVPFHRRLPLLLGRLRTAKVEELPLVLAAALGSIEYRSIGLPAPPRVVGGRVVPPPWKPKTYAELGQLRRDAARQILDTLDKLPKDHAPVALSFVAGHLHDFRGLGVFDHVQKLFRSDRLSEPIRRRLVASLDNQIAFLREKGKEGQANLELKLLEKWLVQLAPADLASRVRDLTAQTYWQAWDHEGRIARFDGLAKELVAQPETFRNLADWFDSPEAMSTRELVFGVGVQDEDARLAEIVRDWLRVDRCRQAVVGYLCGTATRCRGLPTEWVDLLDTLATKKPEVTAWVTTSVDFSPRGLTRLLRLIDWLPSPASRFLFPLAMGEWLRVVRPADRIHILKTLVQLADSGDAEAGEFGTELIHMWAHGDQEVVDPALASLALNLASRPIRKNNGHRFYAWQQVLLALCSLYPRQVAEIVLGRITEPAASHERWSEQNSGILSRAAAANPADVMEAIGNVLLDEKRRVIFGISVFHGLFEAIGLSQVKSWVEQHGIDYLHWIARHLPSPHLDEQKRPVLPPLTDWLFREHEDDEQAFQWFLMGRHSGEAYHEGEVDPGRTREEMQPFFEHELHRVRQWARYEVASAEEHAKFFREMDEEFERR